MISDIMYSSLLNYISIVNELINTDVKIIISFDNNISSKFFCRSTPDYYHFDILNKTEKTIYFFNKKCKISLYVNGRQYWNNLNIDMNQTIFINYKTMLNNKSIGLTNNKSMM